MPATAPTSPDVPATSLRDKLLNVLVCPADVFEEVVATPRNHSNWRLPTLLVCLTGMILVGATTTGEHTAAAVSGLIDTGTISRMDSEQLAGNWKLGSRFAVCLGAFVGTTWSAFVLWFMGRVFLKVRFPFFKALEVVGLTGVILVLESVMTMLLVLAADNTSARPALSLLAGSTATGKVEAMLSLANVFYLWMTATLAIGLSKLSGVSVKEAAFWVFGYWIVLRLALVILC